MTTSASSPPDWASCTNRPAGVTHPTRTTTDADAPDPTGDVLAELARQPCGTVGSRMAKSAVDAAALSSPVASTLGRLFGSTVGPPGLNVHPRVINRITPMIATSTTTAVTMSRMVVLARAGGAGSSSDSTVGPGGCAMSSSLQYAR